MPAPQRWRQIAVFCALWSVAGGAVGWYLGAFSADYVMMMVDQLPHAVMNEEKFQKVSDAFTKLGLPLVLIGAFTPLPFKVIAISAGLFGYPIIPFLAVATFGRVARFLLVAAMVRYHKNMQIVDGFDSGALILVFIGFWMTS